MRPCPNCSRTVATDTRRPAATAATNALWAALWHEHQLVQDQESRLHANDCAARTLRTRNYFTQAPSDAARPIVLSGSPAHALGSCRQLRRDAGRSASIERMSIEPECWP